MLLATAAFFFYKAASVSPIANPEVEGDSEIVDDKRWRSIVEGWNVDSEGCDIRTARVALLSVPSYRKTLVFEYIHCGPEPEQFRATQDQILSKAKYPRIQGEVVEEDPFIEYWVLDSMQETEDFIKALIAAMPVADAREHCVVSEETQDASYLYGSKEGVYVVTPDEFLLEKTRVNGFDYDDTCAQYGPPLSVSFFKRVENILFLVRVGQQIPPHFDVKSFRLE